MNAHLRFRNSDGTTKDWLIEETPEGFRTRWGRTGQVNQEKTFDKKRFPGGVYNEMRKRVQAQLRQGYEYVEGVPAGCPQGAVWQSAEERTVPPATEKAPAFEPPAASTANRTATNPTESSEAPVWDLSRSWYPLFL
jgi:hypothetical protein